MPAGTYDAAYNTYGEFINDYRAEDPKVYLKDLSAYAGKTGDDGLLFRHACVMTAAHQLSGGDYNAPYNERAVVMESKRLMKAPEYRIACSDRNVLALANFGRLNDFEKVVSQPGSFAPCMRKRRVIWINVRSRSRTPAESIFPARTP